MKAAHNQRWWNLDFQSLLFFQKYLAIHSLWRISFISCLCISNSMPPVSYQSLHENKFYLKFKLWVIAASHYKKLIPKLHEKNRLGNYDSCKKIKIYHYCFLHAMPVWPLYDCNGHTLTAMTCPTNVVNVSSSLALCHVRRRRNGGKKNHNELSASAVHSILWIKW